MRSFNVTAKRWGPYWELHIAAADGTHAGVTQSRTLGTAERMVRDYLALDHDRNPADFDVTVTPVLDGISPPTPRPRGKPCVVLSRPSGTRPPGPGTSPAG